MAEQTDRVPRFDPLSVLWRVFAAPQTLLILMGLLALALVASVLIPQIPATYTEDPQAWLAMQTGISAQAGSILHALGMFNVLSSLWFRALLAFLGLCLFVRLVDSAELAWLITRREGLTPSRFFVWSTHSPRRQVSVSLPVHETMERVSALLSEHGYWTRSSPDISILRAVAVRRGLMFWTRPFAYGSLLVALVCATVTSSWGWQGEPWRPREGEVHAVGHDTPYSVRLDAFSLVPGEGQQPPEYSSMVTWLEGESVVDRGLVGAGRTSSHAGFTLRQVGYVPIVRMRGWDGDDQPLMLETEGDVLSMTGEAEIRFASTADQPLVLVPNEDLLLMLSFEQGCNGDGPALQVKRIGKDSGDQEALGALHESGSVSVDDLRFEVNLAFVPILQVDRHPAMGTTLISLVLFIVALTVGWLVPPRLLWIATVEEEHKGAIRLLALAGAGAQSWLSQVTGLFQEVMRDDA